MIGFLNRGVSESDDMVIAILKISFVSAPDNLVMEIAIEI